MTSLPQTKDLDISRESAPHRTAIDLAESFDFANDGLREAIPLLHISRGDAVIITDGPGHSAGGGEIDLAQTICWGRGLQASTTGDCVRIDGQLVPLCTQIFSQYTDDTSSCR